MIGPIESFGALIALLIAGLTGALAVVSKLLSNEKEKRKAAEEVVEVAIETMQREREAQKKADDATKVAKEEEEKTVKKARATPKTKRTHFQEK